MMRHLKFILPYNALRSVYFSLVHSYLNYCPLVYSNTFRSHLLPLQRQQNTSTEGICSISCFVTKQIKCSKYVCYIEYPSSYQFVIFQSVLFIVQYRKKALPAYFYESELLQVLDGVDSCRQSRRQWMVRQPLIKSERSRFH